MNELECKIAELREPSPIVADSDEISIGDCSPNGGWVLEWINGNSPGTSVPGWIPRKFDAALAFELLEEMHGQLRAIQTADLGGWEWEAVPHSGEFRYAATKEEAIALAWIQWKESLNDHPRH